MKVFRVLLPVAAALFTALAWALWTVTREWEALLFVVIATVLTVVSAYGALRSSRGGDDGGAAPE